MSDNNNNENADARSSLDEPLLLLRDNTDGGVTRTPPRHAFFRLPGRRTQSAHEQEEQGGSLRQESRNEQQQQQLQLPDLNNPGGGHGNSSTNDNMVVAVQTPPAPPPPRRSNTTRNVVSMNVQALFEQENEMQRRALFLWGRPYASFVSSSSFWCRDWPLAAILGLVTGGLSLAFVACAHWMLRQWLHWSNHHDDDGISIMEHNGGNGKVWWILITTLGGILTGMIYWLPTRGFFGGRFPLFGGGGFMATRTLFHDLSSSSDSSTRQETAASQVDDDDIRQAPVIVLASFVALATGAPLGPEQALGSMASGLARWVATRVEAISNQLCSRPRHDEDDSSPPRFLHWISSLAAASLGGFFASPLLGPVLVHELAVVARPNRLVVGAATASAATTRQNNNGSGVATASSTVSISSNNPFEEEDTSPASPRRGQDIDGLQHDYMEGFLLNVTSAIMASVWIRALFHDLLPSNALLEPPLTVYDDDDDENDAGGGRHYWRHLAWAIPMGLACGALASAAVVLISAARYLRQATCRLLQSRLGNGSPTSFAWIPLVVFPILAGTFHGCLAYYYPHAAGMGLSFVRAAWNDAMQQLQQSRQQQQETTEQQALLLGASSNSSLLGQPSALIMIALTKTVGMAVCTGWGLIGGPILPMVVAGQCLGFVFASLFSSSSAGAATAVLITVPCCMAATPVAICPTPITAVLMIATILHCSVEQTIGPMLVACLSAWTVSGGLGILQKMGQVQADMSAFDSGGQNEGGGGSTNNNHQVHNNASGGEQYDDANDVSALTQSDDELLQNVRSTIFGGVSNL